jgi:hypothetical protein
MLKEAFAAMAHAKFARAPPSLGTSASSVRSCDVLNPPAGTALIATRARSLLQDG